MKDRTPTTKRRRARLKSDNRIGTISPCEPTYVFDWLFQADTGGSMPVLESEIERIAE